MIRRSRLVPGSLLLCALTAGLHAQEDHTQEDRIAPPEGTVNFAEHIAPIIFRHCIQCHGPEPSAPFELHDFETVRAKGRQISQVTSKGTMPPAVAEPDYGTIANSGRLTKLEIDLIGQWVRQGSKPGDLDKIPPRPARSTDWKLGPPDVALPIDEPFVVPADAYGLSRNFVLPLQLDSGRWLRAIALKRHSPSYLRAFVYIDQSGSTVNLEPDDLDGVVVGDGSLTFAPQPAFGGQQLVTRPWPWPSSIAQRLSPGASMVLQIHFQATGVEETVEPEVGLYFADSAPSRTLVTVSLGSTDFTIPAEDAAYRIQSRFTLPVPVQAVGVLPNGHRLATEMKGWATLPDGSEEGLVWAKQWDYNHQKQYWYESPIELPEGTVLEMDFRYDNSSDNFDNPNYPPEEVGWGLRLQSEVAGLNVQVIVADEHLSALDEAYAEYRNR